MRTTELRPVQLGAIKSPARLREKISISRLGRILPFSRTSFREPSAENVERLTLAVGFRTAMHQATEALDAFTTAAKHQTARAGTQAQEAA